MKKLFVNVNMVVNREMIRRETRNGQEFIVIQSATLPDNVVMNGGLYPADEIANGFASLEGTFAPLGHPTDANGNLLSAATPEAVENFHVGARNENVRRENGRVWLDKAINVSYAMKSDKGQRLLDRIAAVESGAGAPIHTSTGLMLSREESEGVVNGKEYKWVARNMVFDHDAILLDEPGAATPEDGVGIAVNADGEQVQVMNVNLDAVNEMSLNEIRDLLNDAVRAKFQQGDNFVWVEDVYADHLIFERDGKTHRVSYTITDGVVAFADDMVEVKRQVKYSPVAMMNRLLSMLGFAQSRDTAYNSGSEYSLTNEDDPMKEQIVERLKAANAYKDGMSDADALAAYVKLEANAEQQKPETDITAVVTAAVNAAVAPLAEKLDAVEAKANAQAEAEKAQHIEAVVNAGLLEQEDAEKLDAPMLAKMAANCSKGAGTSFLNPIFGANAKDEFNIEMPE